MTIQAHAEDRRTMVQKISEHLQVKARYQGPPTFSYSIGPVTVARDGSITVEYAEMLEALKPFLLENGFIEPEVETLAISLPTEGMDGNQLRNLMFLLYSYQHLLNRVTQCESFAISEAVTVRLGEYVPETPSDFETLMNDFKALGDLTGIDFQDGAVMLRFPLEEAPEKNMRIPTWPAPWCASARAKRVNTEIHRRKREVCDGVPWLLRLGLAALISKHPGICCSTASRVTPLSATMPMP